MVSLKVRSKQRLRIYLGWLAATAGLIVAACFVVNCLVDPLWYLKGNVLTGVNYPFNERLATVIRFLPRLGDYDCVIFGTSRGSLLPEEKIDGGAPPLRMKSGTTTACSGPMNSARLRSTMIRRGTKPCSRKYFA